MDEGDSSMDEGDPTSKVSVLGFGCVVLVCCRLEMVIVPLQSLRKRLLLRTLR